MNSQSEKLNLSQQFPYLQIQKLQNETVCGYYQRNTQQINSFCTSQYFGLVKIYDLNTQLLLQTNCCILISPTHAITVKDQFLNEKGEFIYKIDQINVAFSELRTQVISYILLDRFIILNLQLNAGDIFGYVGLVQRQSDTMNQQSHEYDQDQITFIQGFNEYGSISYFQAIVYREDSKEYEAPNCGFVRLLQGCAMLKQDGEFGICLHGLVSYSDEKQRIIIQKLSFTDIFVIAEVILAAGNTLSEQKIDISALYSLDQKTFLNPKSNIYRKSLGFEDNIQSLEQLNKRQIQLIDIKVINSQILCAISKQGHLFIINIDQNLIEHTIQLDEQPSIVQVFHDELFIGLNKKIIVINYAQGYQINRTYNFQSQILSLKQIDDNQDCNSQNCLYIVGCYDGLYQIKMGEKIPQKIEIPNFKLEKVLSIQINQEIIEQAPINCYKVLCNSDQLIISAAEKILIIDRNRKFIIKKFIAHSKNVYFIEQVRVDLLLSGSSDRQLILWDKKTGNLLKAIQHTNPIYSGYLLNPSELVTIDYNTIWIFNTITFQFTKYEYHKKPITCSTKASSSSFITCDTSNQIILWKADSFEIESFMESKFKIGKQPQVQACNETDSHSLEQRFSENEYDFNYVPRNIKGPSLLKYQIELQEQTLAQKDLQLLLEDQICQNIEERLFYQQQMQLMKLNIEEKNSEIQKIITTLSKKKQKITNTLEEANKNQENSASKIAMLNQQLKQQLDKQASKTSDAAGLQNQENQLTVKKQANIYIDDYVQTNQKAPNQLISVDHLTKSSYSNQFSTEQTCKSLQNSQKLTQFEIGLTNNQISDNYGSLSQTQSQNSKTYQTGQNEIKPHESQWQKQQDVSSQYQTNKRVSNVQNNPEQFISNHQFGCEDNLKLFNNQKEQVYLNNSKEQKGLLHADIQQQNGHFIRFTESNLQYDKENDDEQQIQRNFIGDENNMKYNHQKYEQSIEEQYFYQTQTNFSIKPIPVQNSVKNMTEQSSEKNSKSHEIKYQQIRDSDDQFYQKPSSNNSYIQQINQILNQMQILKQSQQSTTQKNKDFLHASKNSQNEQSQIKDSNSLKQNDILLNLLNQSAAMPENQNFKLESIIQILSSQLSQNQNESLEQFYQVSQEQLCSKTSAEQIQKQQNPQILDSKILQNSNQKIQEQELSKSQKIIQKIENMQKLEEKLKKNDPILQQLCSLIQSSK
ncbi:hypothetical protein ABPG74_011310 [Tetrahymena malaccensis]